ncbi:MAG: hypothetical protein LCH32_10105 [Bacteroidetes bacterium]|nr:hypothetical protein [Bacteroidota bacterium]
MNLKTKIDNIWIGLIVGIIFPMVIYFFIWMFTKSYISFPSRYTNYLINGQLLSGHIKICGIANLALFYLGLKTKSDKFTRGIIFALLIYVVLVAYVTYYVEPSFE